MLRLYSIFCGQKQTLTLPTSEWRGRTTAIVITENPRQNLALGRGGGSSGSRIEVPNLDLRVLSIQVQGESLLWGQGPRLWGAPGGTAGGDQWHGKVCP